MAASPDWKVYSADGEYVASCKYPEDAAMIITGRMGGTIRWGHSKKHTVWTEGQEAQPAGESFDVVAKTCYTRRQGFLDSMRATYTSNPQVAEHGKAVRCQCEDSTCFHHGTEPCKHEGYIQVSPSYLMCGTCATAWTLARAREREEAQG